MSDVNLQNIANEVNTMMEREGYNPNASIAPTAEVERPGVIIGQRPTHPPTDATVTSAVSTAPKAVPISLDDENPIATVAAMTGSTVICDGITTEMVRLALPNMTDEEFNEKLPMFRNLLPQPTFVSYRKDLIMKGFTADEALTATLNYLMREGGEKPTEPPVEVRIDKSQEDSVEFTDDEKDKLYRAKAIRLVVVEDKDLGTLPIEKVDITHRAEIMHTLRGGLSKYSVPMPTTGDYFTFRGAQIVQLASVVQNGDENPSDVLSRKAQLLYDRFVGGTVLQKGDRKNTLSYEEFCNKVSYSDVDIGLFGVLCAGQMEESETELNCQKCKHKWQHKYNTKTLLSMDGFNDFFKERTNNILKYSSDKTKMIDYNTIMTQVIRYKSPFTQNCYDVEMPSIAKAMRFFESVDPKDNLKSYFSMIGMYIHTLYVWNEETYKYIPITSNEEDISLLLDTMALIPEVDMQMLVKQINEHYMVTPTFRLSVSCPQCNTKSNLDLSIEQLVFLKAQDTYVAMT